MAAPFIEIRTRYLEAKGDDLAIRLSGFGFKDDFR